MSLMERVILVKYSLCSCDKNNSKYTVISRKNLKNETKIEILIIETSSKSRTKYRVLWYKQLITMERDRQLSQPLARCFYSRRRSRYRGVVQRGKQPTWPSFNVKERQQSGGESPLDLAVAFVQIDPSEESFSRKLHAFPPSPRAHEHYPPPMRGFVPEVLRIRGACTTREIIRQCRWRLFTNTKRWSLLPWDRPE